MNPQQTASNNFHAHLDNCIKCDGQPFNLCSIGQVLVAEIMPATGRNKKRKKVFDTLDDLVGKFLYYDRKEDEDLPRGKIEEYIKDGIITVDEMVAAFRSYLEENDK